jgi:hypothetical protein
MIQDEQSRGKSKTESGRRMLGLERLDANTATVLATIVGPILAVQAQKMVERATASRQRREWVFSTLMATRQARLSIDHVRALNMIDLAFYGFRVPLTGMIWRNKKSKAVIRAWHVYHAHLSLPPERRVQTEADQRDWGGRADELFTNLLDCLADSTKYEFDRDELRSGSYSPEAHGNVEMQQDAIRRLTLEVLEGKKHVPMDVKSWPVDPTATDQQRNVQNELLENQRELLNDLKRILDKLSDHATASALPKSE